MNARKHYLKMASRWQKFLAIFLVAGITFTLISIQYRMQEVHAETYPEWNATTAYPANSIVMHKRAIWQSKWYSVNEEPMDVLGNAWTCIRPAPPIPPANAEYPDGYDISAVFFDDFNMYNTSDDQRLKDFGYEVSDRAGGPGPGGCIWSKNNVTFVADANNSGNKFLRLTSTTNGQGNDTVQAELLAPRQFLYGTYAARVKFSDTPAYGPDGDQIVQTFYTISPYTLANHTDYGEMDFEYLPNGGWGKSVSTMWNTTWDTANDRVTEATSQSFEGWHTCVIQCSSSEVKYYIDGHLLATHSGKYVPTTPMFLSFNQWFIDGIWAGGSSQRAYIQDVDWVYYAKDRLIVPAQAEANVNYYRNNSISRKDTVKNSGTSNGPIAAIITVDNPVNEGSYVITAKVFPNSTATSIDIYEGSNKVFTQSVIPNYASEQNFMYTVTNKNDGIYSYRADLSNYNGTTQSATTTVQVTSSQGGQISPAVLSVNNGNNTGNYTITAIVPANNTADNIKLYETFGGTTTTVLNNNITSNTSSQQIITYNATNKVEGTYTYRADVSDANGNIVESNVLTILVHFDTGGSSINVAQGKPITASDTINGNPAYITDGDKSTDNYIGVTQNLQWIQIDLGQNYNINRINLWHYFGDGRTYHDVIVRVSSDASFRTGVTTVFNNDTNNSAGLGAGTDTKYAESSSGKTINFNTLNARYVRLYSNGSSANIYNHYVEVEVWADEGGEETLVENVALGKNITASDTINGNPAYITDGNKSTDNYIGVTQNLQWIQIDLGQNYNINRINLWHYFGDGRTYHDVIVRVSSDASFRTGVTTVFNNDTNNSAGLGAGTDAEYAESSSGKTINFNTLNARYVRLYSNGSSANIYNHYVEVEVWTAGSSGGTGNISKAMFDDFNYMSSSDPKLSLNGWSVKTGVAGPGPSGCSWSANNVIFVTDPQDSNNRLLRLTASTNGTATGTSQAEILTASMKYFEGTYAARVRFTDTPISGSDGAAINQTFFTISPLDYDNDPNYSELDFEYLANGGWGISGATMWTTSWYTYTNNPWSKDNVYNLFNSSHDGWHTLVCTVMDGEIKYYIDGILKATHSGKYYPRKNMAIDFNLWFLAEGPLTPSTYVQDVDWVYHAKDTKLTPEQVDIEIQGYRSKGINFTDNVD